MLEYVVLRVTTAVKNLHRFPPGVLVNSGMIGFERRVSQLFCMSTVFCKAAMLTYTPMSKLGLYMVLSLQTVLGRVQAIV